VAQSWYDENESYDYNNPGWNQHCTNFTQMIWKSTSRVGVGFARRPGGMLYIVAHYFPPGNVGSFRHNVVPPTMIGSALVQHDSDRPVLPIPTSGRVPPPPPPPPDVPPPPPPDYKNSGNFIRRAMLEAYSPFNLTSPPRGQQDDPPSPLVEKKNKKGGGGTPPPIPEDDSKSNQIRFARALGTEGRRVKTSSALVSRRTGKVKSAALDYWDAALHMIHFKRPEGAERKLSASGAHTSLAKVRATKTFNKDPSMEQVSGVMEREFMGKMDKSQENLLQQLRGVFSAADEDSDGFLSIAELEEALLSFGVMPTDDLIEHFIMLARNDGKIDLATFMYVFSKTKGSATAMKNCGEDVTELFKFLDKPYGKGDEDEEEDGVPFRVTPEQIKHVLSEVDVPNRLSKEEAQDFLIYADQMIRKNTSSSRGIDGAAFEDLLSVLMDT
jgi:hypothetical protein